ncbi:MAG: hypothetical protein WC598_14875 [Methanoregula sp.]
MNFGDTRDLFTFDLVRHIMKADPAFDSFSFIPMLTGADEGARGKKCGKTDLAKAKKSGKAGSQNLDLVAQMERLQEIEDDLDYFQHIRGYFNKEQILAHIVSDQKFTHQDRTRYFSNILPRIPKKSLIFLDPDTGLEESRPTEKHLLFAEVKQIADRMDKNSVLMIYQHFPRVKHDGYVRERGSRLNELTGMDPLTITDNEIIFFLLAKDPKLRTRVEEIIERYANSYPLLTSCCGD